MNNFTFIGRLVRDPEIYTTGANDTLIARYSIAVQRDKDTADFINITAFNKTADFVEKYLTKGTKVAVTGRVQSGRYTDNEGKTQYTVDFIANSHEFCESKSVTNEFIPIDDVEEYENNDVKEPPVKPQRATRTKRTTRTR